MSTTSVVPTWKAEFNERVANFARVIGVGEDKVREVLSELGADGQSEQSLSILESEEFLPLSDLFKYFVDTKLTQIAKVRLGNKELRANSNKSQPVSELSGLSQSIEALAKSSRPRSAWTDDELLDAYEQNDTETLETLRKRAHGRHCIVYNANGSVNKSVSLDLLKAAKRQVTNDRHLVNGALVRVYRPGEFPLTMIDESPFFRNVPLVAGVCGESGTDWSGISQEIRVLCRIHVFDIETVKLGKTALRDIWQDAKNLSVNDFRQKYAEAGLKYDELASKESLPKLKMDPRANGDASTAKRDTAF